MERITRFEWDARNAGHIEAKHELRPEEVEGVFRSGPLLRRAREGRMTALGRTDAGGGTFLWCSR
ncbi:MAG: hypothetical protein ACUVRC_10810 [Desulfotomaculales bacterium]